MFVANFVNKLVSMHTLLSTAKHFVTHNSTNNARSSVLITANQNDTTTR